MQHRILNRKPGGACTPRRSSDGGQSNLPNQPVEHEPGVEFGGAILRGGVELDLARNPSLGHRDGPAAHLVRSFKMVAVDQSADDTREIDVGEYINEVVDSLVPTLRKSGVKAEAVASGRLLMKTVPGDLSHIVTNLIMNAALHGFSDRPDRDDKQIRVSAKAGTKDVTIEVVDNGRGIPLDIREKIFEPFFTTARSTGGSGLGLNIVYNTVYHKLGGSIEVGDAKGGGTRFKITLPFEHRKAA